MATAQLALGNGLQLERLTRPGEFGKLRLVVPDPATRVPATLP
jgi:hypothetical protein